jgi:hypothetical protein
MRTIGNNNYSAKPMGSIATKLKTTGNHGNKSVQNKSH